MNRLKESTKLWNGIKILFWLVIFAFFIYSFQNIIDFEEISISKQKDSDQLQSSLLLDVLYSGIDE